VDQIITSNGFPLLAHAGAISHEQMELAANQENDADLKALESKIKRRRKKWKVRN
jgi:hypothetical protein